MPKILGKLKALVRGRLSVSQRFVLLSFLCVLAVTVLVCVASSAVLRRQLVVHDGAVIADLASRLFTSSVPAEFFVVPSGAPPAGAEQLREFARSEQVVRFMVYAADGRVLWSDDASLTGRHFGENAKVAAALRGETIAEISQPGAEGHHSTLRGFPRVEEVYTPVRYQPNGPIVGVIELYRAPTTLFAVLDHGVVVVWLLGGIAGATLYLTLIIVARNCSRTQVRLEAELAGYARVLQARVDERTRELAQKAKYLSILHAVSSVLGRSLETREILGRALDELADGKGFDGGWIQLLPDGNHTEPLVVRRGVSEEVVQRFAAHADAVARSGQACVLALEQASEGRTGAAAWARGLVLASISVGDQPLGALAVAGPGVDRFTPDDTQLLSSVGRQIGVAVGNARLYATTREREQEARILFETTGRLGELADGDALLKAIVEGAVSLTHASYGGTGFPDGDEMVIRRLVDAPERGPAVLRLKIAGCLAGRTFVSGVPQVANDIAGDPRANRTTAQALGVRNLACVPLQRRGRVIGVLFVGNKETAPFTEQDVIRLRAFAHHAAVALENARLLQETKSTKEYLENLIASSVDAIVTVAPNGRITFVSQGGRQMFGDGNGELAGQPARSFWLRGARDFRVFRTRLRRDGRVQNHETELVAADGARLAVNISASFLRGAAGEVTGVLAVVKDVTSLRRLHEQIVRSERLAAAGLLAAGVAHEVGNPLTCISSLAQVLMARASDEAIRSGLENIEVHVGRIERIVQDLTRLTRPTPATLRETSVRDLVDTAVSLARHNPVVRRMKVDSVVDPTLPLVRVAPDHLVQVFLNLILNAADAGGKLTVRAGRSGNTIRVSFEDSGCGMTAEQMHHLFDPFHSTKNSDNRLGLGLFVSHEIVQQHGGDLLVDSQPGAGSTITVVLPLEPLRPVVEAVA
jgi:two-component system NtrC family sensor kinase